MAHLQYMPGDPRLVDQLVYELKSKGIFDQFRKECIADVDTRPAYQNLRQRVESSVSMFLSRQTWKPDLNKNQLREKLRKHILDGNYLEQGVERIVDQVVNPKVASVFIPQVEDLVYNYLGIARKKSTTATETSNGKLEDLLPTDLEAVSPGSVHDDKDDMEDYKQEDKMEIDEEDKAKEEIKETNEKMEVQEAKTESADDGDIMIPLPAEDLKVENIPPPCNSPPKVELDKIELPKEMSAPMDIPLPTEVPKSEKDQYFKPVQSDDEDTSDSDSSVRRNMSPLTPIRNFNNENSCDAQQAFENDSDSKSNDKKEPSSFRFTIESKSPENSSDVAKVEKKDDQTDLSYQFNNQVNINFNTPLYEDSSNSNNLQIDYESDANSKTNAEKNQEAEQHSQDSKKDIKSEDKKKEHKSSHRSRESNRHSSSSKDRRTDSKHTSSKDRKDDKKSDRKSSKDDKYSKSSHRERSRDRNEKKDSRDSSKHRTSSSHKSSSNKDSKSHRSSSSSQKHSSSSKNTSSSDKKSSSRSSKEKERSSDKSKEHRSSRDSKHSSSSRSDKDRKSSSSSKSSSKDEKDKDKKEKKETDDHYSLSGRSNNNRRSTDRDSNDGSSSSKGSHNHSSSKSSETKKNNKGGSSKSENTSSSDSTSPSDKEIQTNQAKDAGGTMQQKPVRVETHLETPISTPPRLPFVPDVTIKKPKIAANMEEAKRLMKMRKFLEDEQKRMNQEAALLLEFQANVRPSLSQVYSSIPGPELEFACVTHTVVEPSDNIQIVSSNTPYETETAGSYNDSIVNNVEGYNEIMEAVHGSGENAQVNQELISIENLENRTEVINNLGVENNSENEECSTRSVGIERNTTTPDVKHETSIEDILTDKDTSDSTTHDVKGTEKKFEVVIITEELSESEEPDNVVEKEVKNNKSKEELGYFAEHEKYSAELERDKFSKFLKSYKNEYSSKSKIYLINCDTYEENIFKDISRKFGDYDIVNYYKNGHMAKVHKNTKNIVKNINLSTEIALPLTPVKMAHTSQSPVSPVFSPTKSECSFELSSDYDAKLEEMVNKTSRQEIMEIILGGVMPDESPSKMPKIDYFMESNIEENPVKRKLTEVESGDNNNRQVLTPHKMRKMSGSDQISSTTEDSQVSSRACNAGRSKYLGKARRVGLPKPKRAPLPNSPSSDKSVENYEQNGPQTPNGKVKAPRKVQRYDTSDLYKPKLHYLSRRNIS